MKTCDEMLEKTLHLADLMAETADQGDALREDVGCGVLYGFLRDSAFKIRKMAEEEVESHIRKTGRKKEKGKKEAAGPAKGSGRRANAGDLNKS